jgi:hypothetical protein
MALVVAPFLLNAMEELERRDDSSGYNNKSRDPKYSGGQFPRDPDTGHQPRAERAEQTLEDLEHNNEITAKAVNDLILFTQAGKTVPCLRACNYLEITVKI